MIKYVISKEFVEMSQFHINLCELFILYYTISNYLQE